jgi:hypothetical protein
MAVGHQTFKKILVSADPDQINTYPDAELCCNEWCAGLMTW